MTLHVFVNKEGEVLASGPAPQDPSSRKVVDGPAFAGFFPADDMADGITGFEMEVDEQDLPQGGRAGVGKFHARLGEMVRKNRPKLKKVFPR